MDAVIKKDVLNRLHRVQGHLKNVEKMVQEDGYCINILHQSLAVRRALEEAEAKILDNHLHTCATHAISGGNREKAIQELLEVFKKI